ncbi:MAG: hypothetical protein KKC68_01900 [Candidatus Thermoplasmatota archaeon]|nr:hypothetical protein [Candidatus Thermoplasmatota archaeon]
MSEKKDVLKLKRFSPKPINCCPNVRDSIVNISLRGIPGGINNKAKSKSNSGGIKKGPINKNEFEIHSKTPSFFLLGATVP